MQELISYKLTFFCDFYLCLQFVLCIFSGNGSSSPAQNSTRSISPNTNTTNSLTTTNNNNINNNNNNTSSNNNNNINNSPFIQQPVSPQTPLQLQISPQLQQQQSHHLLSNSASLGSLTPTFPTPQVFEYFSCDNALLTKLILQTSQSSFKTSPINGSVHVSGSVSEITMPMPGGPVVVVPTPGTPNSKAKVTISNSILRLEIF